MKLNQLDPTKPTSDTLKAITQKDRVVLDKTLVRFETPHDWALIFVLANQNAVNAIETLGQKEAIEALKFKKLVLEKIGAKYSDFVSYINLM